MHVRGSLLVEVVSEHLWLETNRKSVSLHGELEAHAQVAPETIGTPRRTTSKTTSRCSQNASGRVATRMHWHALKKKKVVSPALVSAPLHDTIVKEYEASPASWAVSKVAAKGVGSSAFAAVEMLPAGWAAVK